MLISSGKDMQLCENMMREIKHVMKESKVMKMSTTLLDAHVRDKSGN